jgi:hypothetical protein
VIKALRLCVCSIIAVLSFARPAAADWHFTPFIGTTFGGNSTFIGSESLLTEQKFFGRKDLVVGGSVAHIGRGLLGVEGIFVYVPGIVNPELEPDETSPETEQLIVGSYSIAAMGNVVLTTPRAWNEHGLRPFVSGGFGLLHLTTETIRDALLFRRTVMGYNVGGGAIGFVSDRTGVRFEARRFAYVKPSESSGFSIGNETYSYWTATVGVVFRY